MRTTNPIDPDIDELLPGYVNGSLQGAQCDAVERYLMDHPEAAAEVELLRAVRGGVKTARTGESSPGELGWHRLQRALRDEPRRVAGQRPGWWRPALAAAIVVIIVQGALLTTLWRHPPMITPLSGPVPVGTVVQIRFEPTATEQQIRALLDSVDGRFVDGPGALGVYRVRLDRTGNRRPVDKKIGQLRAARGIVRYVALE